MFELCAKCGGKIELMYKAHGSGLEIGYAEGVRDANALYNERIKDVHENEEGIRLGLSMAREFFVSKCSAIESLHAIEFRQLIKSFDQQFEFYMTEEKDDG